MNNEVPLGLYQEHGGGWTGNRGDMARARMPCWAVCTLLVVVGLAAVLPGAKSKGTDLESQDESLWQLLIGKLAGG